MVMGLHIKLHLRLSLAQLNLHLCHTLLLHDSSICSRAILERSLHGGSAKQSNWCRQQIHAGLQAGLSLFSISSWNLQDSFCVWLWVMFPLHGLAVRILQYDLGPPRGH